MKKRREARPKKQTEAPVSSQSPSLPGATPEPLSDERERVPILGALRGEVMVFQAMTILDISRGGAQIETAFPLQLDSLHDFRLTLGDQSVVVKGRIAHCHIGDLEEERVGYRTGVEFIDPPEHVREAITEFIDSLKSQRKR
ncbi:MAG: PilZ domain-containing protein [Vicinamibacterales bacterium]